MAQFPVFISIVLVVRNQDERLVAIVEETAACIRDLVSDYELIVVDNASTDTSVKVLKDLTRAEGQPNMQVYALTKEVDDDTAAWVGLENALGDFVAVVDPMTDDVHLIPQMLEKSMDGIDMVLATNQQRPKQGWAYRAGLKGFNALYRYFNGIHLGNEAPHYRLLSKRVVNFILQHSQPAMTYRHLPVTGGFARANLTYSSPPKISHTRHLGESFDRGMRLLVSTTRAPMRLVTALSLFGALANLVYSAYVLAIALFKPDVAPGWVSLSLQQSGMFFLLSLVLLVLGEYVLHMSSLTNEGPLYHVAQEFTSARMTRREKLNVEDVASLEVVATAASTRRDL
ncbi:glycosyl transferase [Paraburkholderia monticola]|uniref:Glycosyl transferase n=1 Tax=Paraburkholderia monticola TaxID=1399968 RepID=A0A149Q171_9BURK|nr:glycosyltransferase [Paraburkholderia monticola]KXU90974.1 glycosyl transferase [Paraburkholderia monticola]